jgi:tetratricopeptide (TPR) repeat protein
MKMTHMFAIGICVVVIIAVVAGVVLMQKPAQATTSSDPFTTAGRLYSDSVDLANAGKYTQALQAADYALAQNVSSLMPVIQANRAGILVMLGRNEEAIAAADAAINTPGNLTTTWSIAWFNKGNALRALGKTADAQAAYAEATKLDPTLVNPYKTS